MRPAETDPGLLIKSVLGSSLWVRPDDVTRRRALEEYRERLFYLEETQGPFPVAGSAVRRILHNYAWHETRATTSADKRTMDTEGEKQQKMR